MDAIRKRVEQREAETLSPYAQRAADSSGRLVEEAGDEVRTCYQRDRDRILHSKPFRRLKHKTQVFIDPEGDHFRTRLTHSLEVSQIARTVARALSLNEDLTEAIALGHDLGHPPFGHAGEQCLEEAILATPDSSLVGFRHDDHALRVVDVLTPLNLTHEVRQGMGGHSKGRKDLQDTDGVPTSTLEAAVVRICDRIAYLSHDLDDALRAGLVKSIPPRFSLFGKSQGERIGTMVTDLITNSLDSPHLVMTIDLRQAMNEMKEWLFETVYLAEPEPMNEVRKAKRLLNELYQFYMTNGLPPAYDTEPHASRQQRVVDYIAGMTDRFAIASFESLFIPQRFRDFETKPD